MGDNEKLTHIVLAIQTDIKEMRAEQHENHAALEKDMYRQFAKRDETIAEITTKVTKYETSLCAIKWFLGVFAAVTGWITMNYERVERFFSK